MKTSHTQVWDEEKKDLERRLRERKAVRQSVPKAQG